MVSNGYVLVGVSQVLEAEAVELLIVAGLQLIEGLRLEVGRVDYLVGVVEGVDLVVEGAQEFVGLLLPPREGESEGLGFTVSLPCGSAAAVWPRVS